MMETRSIEQIEEDYDVEAMTNDGLLGYHGGQFSAVYSVGSRWMGHEKVGHDDESLFDAVDEIDSYLRTAKEEDRGEALAYRAMLAAHWNEQFKNGGKRDDDLGPIERADS